MTEPAGAAQRAWLSDQVTHFNAVRPYYEEYAALLENLLRRATGRVAPLAIVMSRPKSVASFAEKALRKREEHSDPVHDFTDLCGARVIARTRDEVNALCRWIKATFEIDVANSVDTSERLGAMEFGYRSVHYIVSIPHDHSLGSEVPNEVIGLKAELQVRTMTEHAWADFDHDLSYKGAFPLPRQWRRQLATLAAELEDADEAFARIEQGLREYAASLGSYVRREDMPEQIAFLELVAEHDHANAELAWRIAKLAAALGQWEKAVAVLSALVDDENLEESPHAVVRDLGVALCKLHPSGTSGFARGQEILGIAAAPSDRHGGLRDPDAIASLAGTWKACGDDVRAKRLYLEAFEVDPTNSYPLVNYLAYELVESGCLDSIAPLRPSIRGALERRRRQAEVGMDRPWSSFDIGFLSLLLNEIDAALDAYVLGISLTGDDWEIQTTLDTLEQISSAVPELGAYPLVHRLLVLGIAARFPNVERSVALAAMATAEVDVLRSPIVVVTGSTAATSIDDLDRHRAVVLEAFDGFNGTAISGGTVHGISELVGDLGNVSAEIQTIGYVPRGVEHNAPNVNVDRDVRRYRELRLTESDVFGPLEPLQGWTDICTSGMRPGEVALLGIGGGPIAAFEYRLALALGARVGVIEGSGREADRLLGDPDWAASTNLYRLTPTARAIREFLGASG
jgi:ppGpp synthetase/RelA/SpoT-type nucleotidyltranferase